MKCLLVTLLFFSLTETLLEEACGFFPVRLIDLVIARLDIRKLANLSSCLALDLKIFLGARIRIDII